MKTHSATVPGTSAVSGDVAGLTAAVVEVEGKFPEEVALLKALVATGAEESNSKPKELETVELTDDETPEGQLPSPQALPLAVLPTPIAAAAPATQPVSGLATGVRQTIATSTDLPPAIPVSPETPFVPEVLSVPLVPASQAPTSPSQPAPSTVPTPTVPAAQVPTAQAPAPASDLPTIGRSILEAFGAIKKEDPAPSIPTPTTSDEPSTPNLGIEILRSFEALGRPSETTVPRTEAAQALPKLVGIVAEQILVSDPLHNQNPEIRIKLADNILPNTEIRIWRDQGQLNVEFVTTDSSVVRTLNEAAPALSQRLGERVHIGASIQVTTGHTASSDTPQDGRSRQQYVPQDPEQQDA